MRRIKFTKLFGRFDYDIELKKDGITIITGPNGYGKSTILRCIDSIKNEIDGLIYFSGLDFEKIEFYTDDGNTVIQKENEKLWIDRTSINIDELKKKIVRYCYRYLPYYRHMGELDKFDESMQEIENIISRTNSLNTLLENRIPIDDLVPMTVINKMKHLKEKYGNTFFIKEQRLINNKKENRRPEKTVVNIIDELPQKIKNRISEISEKYSKVANEYDSTYPYRLFNEKEKIDQNQYKKNMIEMDRKFEKLKEYDISEINSSRGLEFKEEFATALKIYFDDFNNKYKVYEELINKLDLYVSIINSRLTFKKIRISRQEGLEIISDHKKKLALSSLSSGEQQEIVLFYELIFETPDKSLLLIDEPEISLHIVWQKIFMNDLQKVTDLKKLNVIVATHSPQIISNYWDNQIDLGEIYGNEFNNR